MNDRERVWLDAWCAVANQCDPEIPRQDSYHAAWWADEALKSFDERFTPESDNE